MSRDLERLIDSLITDISCYGDLGCTVSHVLESLSTFYENAQRQTGVSAQHSESASALTNQLLWATAWDWLRARKDLSVGANRKWNHLSLSDILAVPDPDSQDGSSSAPSTTGMSEAKGGMITNNQQQRSTDAPRKDLPRKPPRIYVSEDRMWESIAGHAPDYRRVPRLEWMALVGIASTKQQGILQGDLGRLVGQDKRSLPKRTDALAEKGYISKRTTLVRGTKTSKLWLTHFAPALPTDPTKAAAGLPNTADMASDALARDLEPVSWRDRWTGDSVDYISLAQTIMAIVKAYRIIRYHDLRRKLGILGLRWQMKVAAKTCRFFVQTGAIQYVGATLSGKLFKDCLKFDHDLTHEDWSAYLATGKQKNSTYSLAGLGDMDSYGPDGIGPPQSPPDNASASLTSGTRHNFSKKRSSRPTWSDDKPLTVSVFDNISAAGARGLSNKQIGDSTLGSSFRRYLSSISATLATPGLQPKHLSHFQVSSEMHRKGKSQHYRYFAPLLHTALRPATREGTMKGAENAAIDCHSNPALVDVFAAPGVLPDPVRAVGGLTALAQGPGKSSTSGVVKRKAGGMDPPRPKEPDVAPRRAKRMRTSEPMYQESPDDDDFSPGDTGNTRPPPPSAMTTRRGTRSRRVTHTEATFLVTLKVNPDALSNILQTPTKSPEGNAAAGSATADERQPSSMTAGAVPEQFYGLDATSESDTLPSHGPITANADSNGLVTVEKSIIVAPGGTDENSKADTTYPAVEEDDGGPVKRGGRRSKKAAEKRSRPTFKCEKCGGTWKNDVGLKYHLEKSRTTCNPDYVPPAPVPVAPPESVTRLSASVRQTPTARQPRSRQATAPGDNGVQNTDDEQDFTVAQNKDHSRGLRTSRSRRFNGSSEIRFGNQYHRNIGHRRSSKPPSTLRPPTSFAMSTVNGLIKDSSGSVRDMPAGHPFVQSALKRAQLNETPRSNTDRSDKSSINITDENETSLYTSGKECQNGGRRDSALASVEPVLSATSGSGHSRRADLIASDLSHIEALRNSLNGKDSSEPGTMEKILLHILNANGGVFPGGRSVWYAVLATWEAAFPADQPPARQSYKDALARLAKRKKLMISTHAFKDARGVMANYQLLRIPGVDAGSPAGAVMKARIIAAHPKAYTPPTFTPKAGLPEEDNLQAQPVFSSRRKLVQGIEVLDAPVYANKAANERTASPHEGIRQTPRKRKRRVATKQQITLAKNEGPDGTRRKDIFQFFMDGHIGMSDSSRRPDPSAGGTRGFTRHLVFLDPNTYLGQEAPDDASSESLLNHPLSEPTYQASLLKDIVANDCEIRFADTDVIVGDMGTWPNHEIGLFDRDERSFTIRGWMPDSQWFLRQYLPQNLAEMTKWRGRPRTRFPGSNQWMEFCEQVDACFDWELSAEGVKLMLAGSINPEHIFINLGVDDLPGEWENPCLEWNSANQLYASALFDVRAPEQTTTATDHLWGGDLGRQRRRKRRQKNTGTETKELVGIDLKIRSLIMLPKDTDLRDAPKRTSGLDETNETVLIAAFVATRTLLGGADRIIEWGLMMTLFPDMALSAMRRFWSKARKDRRTFINQLTERFQIRFITAYENNEFQPIDFDNYVDYDWPRLIKWTAGLIEDSVELPASKPALGQRYSLASAWADVDNWRDDYYNFQMSVFNRFEAATSRPATSLIDGGRPPAQDSSARDLVTAMSWIRSLCYTPRDKYAPHDIRTKMASIGSGDEKRIQSLLEKAVETLQGQGVITDSKLKALEGRPYRLTETFLPRFMKWTHESKFLDAARFKSLLDGSFRKGEKVRIPYVLKDGEVMAMINLQASGRVSVTTVDVPSIPLGFDPGNYESRKYPKSYYNFGLEIAPTEAYIYDEDLDIIQTAKSSKPPRETQDRAIPLWSDFFGALDRERWSQVLGAVAFVVATRGPLDVPSVCAVLKPYLQEFEVQLWTSGGGFSLDDNEAL
ncbi:TFIIIC transcription initiation factor complex subunits Tfc3 [Colletotrichum sojae]|uniref:TFIIIC transcription initiation factor complex subunits Tfc3 n=1 Tax=Colletotrichum sojae TaxID=2175907 RepID=A0A8H6JNH9_9PEZI|nr:TFIIIC transcription initiation factor complex subunits Tfc3 [Colletotrichum sojae]